MTRTNPGIARVLGAGACGKITDGAVGYGSFIWPTSSHYLSGFDYSPDANHRGIDIAGDTGDPLYATDAGVIVYSGWNDYGYGYMVMIDHGNGWQSLYAHMSSIAVVCGESVGPGRGDWLTGKYGQLLGLAPALRADEHKRRQGQSLGFPPAAVNWMLVNNKKRLEKSCQLSTTGGSF